MEKIHEFKPNDLVTLIDAKVAQELVAANGEIDWLVPIINQDSQRVHCWNSQRR